MDLHASVGVDLSLHEALDDDRFRPEFSPDDGGLTEDERSVTGDFSLKRPLQLKQSLEGHLSFKHAVPSREGFNLFCVLFHREPGRQKRKSAEASEFSGFPRLKVDPEEKRETVTQVLEIWAYGFLP